MKKETIIVSVIGLGNVGRSIVYRLLGNQQYHILINILDPSAAVNGSFLDLSHASCLEHKHQIVMNSQQLLKESRFIFHCAGAAVPPNASRLSVVQESMAITTKIFHDFKSAVDPYIIVVANPVDIISYHTYRLTGVKVLGTGTLLDIARMNYYLQQAFNDRQAEIKTVILGEHGDSMVWMLSQSTINGKPLTAALESDTINKCMQQVKHAAATIKATQGATYYAVSDCAIRIMNEILHPTGAVLPLSSLLTPAMQQLLQCRELFFSLPVTINEKGVTPIPFDYTANELSALRSSANILSDRLAKS